jgi:hypothetical protein
LPGIKLSVKVETGNTDAKVTPERETVSGQKRNIFLKSASACPGLGEKLPI